MTILEVLGLRTSERTVTGTCHGSRVSGAPPWGWGWGHMGRAGVWLSDKSMCCSMSEKSCLLGT